MRLEHAIHGRKTAHTRSLVSCFVRWLHYVTSNDPPAGASDETPVWATLNVFFTHHIVPRFPLFDSCEYDLEAALKPAPEVYASLLRRLDAARAWQSYCSGSQTL